jgi:hypothetical protein
MKSAHQEAEQMIAAFLAKGGRIRKCPEARPTTVVDILQYLRSRSVKIEPLPSRGGRAAYLLGTKAINSKDLVRLANGHRRRQRLPPFDLGRLGISSGLQRQHRTSALRKAGPIGLWP